MRILVIFTDKLVVTLSEEILLCEVISKSRLKPCFSGRKADKVDHYSV